MKQICSTILFLVNIIPAFSQQLDSLRPFTAEDYLVKNHKQRTAAWVLTVVGSTGLIVTLLANAGDAVTGVIITLVSLGTVQPEQHSYLVPYLLSGACIGEGIALFVAASENKRKSYIVPTCLKMEKAPVMQRNAIVPHSFLSIAFQITL